MYKLYNYHGFIMYSVINNNIYINNTLITNKLLN